MIQESIFSQPFHVYRTIDAVNKSSLTEMERSPAHYRWHIDNPEPPTQAMVLGAAFHTFVLEPMLFNEQYFVAKTTERRGTKAWDALEQQASGRIILKPDEGLQIKQMSEQIKAHPQAKRCLDACSETEQTMLWTHLATGEACKARADALSIADCVILDLKTAVDASPLGFERAVINFKYHWQAAFYSDGFQAITGKPATFVFIAVEKEPPYGVGVYVLGAEMLENGRRGYQAAIAKVAECKAKKEWPCYSDSVLELSGPEWMKGNK